MNQEIDHFIGRGGGGGLTKFLILNTQCTRLFIAYIACGSASLYIEMLYFFLTVLALSAAARVANIKIRYDAKTPQLAIFGTHVICMFYCSEVIYLNNSSRKYLEEILIIYFGWVLKNILINMVPTRLFYHQNLPLYWGGGGGGDCCRDYYRSLIVKLVEFIEHGYRQSSKSNESHCVSAV